MKGTDSSGSGEGQVVRSCKCGNEPPDSIRVGNFLTSSREVKLLKSLCCMKLGKSQFSEYHTLKTHFSTAPFNIIKSYAISLWWSYTLKLSTANLFVLGVLHSKPSFLNLSMTINEAGKQQSSSLRHFFCSSNLYAKHSICHYQS